MSDPSLFRIGIDYSCFSFKLFTLYLLYGLIQSTIIFMLCFFLLNTNDMQPGGKNIGFWVTGHMVYGVCIIVANIVIMFRYHNFTGWSEWCSIGMSLNFFTILQFSSMYIPSFDQTFGIFNTFMSQPIIWFQMVGILSLASIFELGYRYYSFLQLEEDEDKLNSYAGSSTLSKNPSGLQNIQSGLSGSSNQQ